MEIDRLIAFIAENPEGDGIVAFEINGKTLSAVTPDQLTADKIEQHIKENSDITRPPIKIVRFKKIRTVRYI